MFENTRTQQKCKSANHNPKSPLNRSRRGKAQLLVRYRLSDDPPGKVREAIGRFGWALLQLHHAGNTGVTSLENPAPRLSHYIIAISTEWEEHSGAFCGRHGRYKLQDSIVILEIVEPEGAANV